ncbi:MAG: membrane protein insertion efficiency factor YidD [Actinobacteria bacterium]|nr:membrane protein insertion efficiency factor YidD [Actinomycetota bacterium]
MNQTPLHAHGLLTRGCLRLIRFYQFAREGRPSPCRFVPSCSTYAAEAVQSHGAVRGVGLASRRVLRCNPWGGQGYDPVPPSRKHIASQNCTHENHISTTVPLPPSQKAC